MDLVKHVVQWGRVAGVKGRIMDWPAAVCSQAMDEANAAIGQTDADEPDYNH